MLGRIGNCGPGYYLKNLSRLDCLNFPILKRFKIGVEMWILEATEQLWVNTSQSKVDNFQVIKGSLDAPNHTISMFNPDGKYFAHFRKAPLLYEL